MLVTYEWKAENTIVYPDGTDDIVDNDFCDRLDEIDADTLRNWITRAEEPTEYQGDTWPCHVRLCLTRSIGSEDTGRTETLYAYVRTDGTLPEVFNLFGDDPSEDTSVRVPQKYHRELAKAVARIGVAHAAR